MKRLYLMRVIKIVAGLILVALSIEVCGVAVVVMHDLTPFFAERFAAKTQDQRERDFRSALETYYVMPIPKEPPSHGKLSPGEMPPIWEWEPPKLRFHTDSMAACPDVAGMPSFIERRNKAWWNRFISSWQAPCAIDFGPVLGFDLSSGPLREYYIVSYDHGRFSQQGSAVSAENLRPVVGSDSRPTGKYYIAGYPGEYFVSAGTHDPYNTFAESWCDALFHSALPSMRAGDMCEAGGGGVTGGPVQLNFPVSAKSVTNVRLTLGVDWRQHWIGTLWVSTKPQSWGNDLVTEYVSELDFFETALMVFLASTLTILILAVRRFIAKSKARPHNSTMPWIEILLETVGRDDDHQVGEMIELISLRREGCAKVVGLVLFLFRDQTNYCAQRCARLMGKTVEKVLKRQRKMS